MVSTKKEVQALQNRVMELERQLVEAQAAILALSLPKEDKLHADRAQQTKQQKTVDITDRKQAEERLRAARDEATWLARLPGENPNPVVRVSNTGIVLYRNPPAANLAGWTCTIHEPLPSPLLSLTQQAAAQGQVVEQDVALGERFYSVSVVPIPGEAYLNLYGRDITERKQAEEQLADQAKLLSSVQDAITATHEQMRITYWNEAAEEIFGWKAEEVLGQSTAELFQTKVPDSNREEAVKSLMETGRYEGEVLYRRKDGVYITAHARSAVLRSTQGGFKGLVTSVQDITERKLAEERFNKAFHASPNALVISRQEDGRIETVNDTFVSFFGYAEEEVIGKTSTELGMFVNPADRREAVRRLQRDKSVRDFELDVRLKSREVRNASLSIEMINIGGKNMMLTTIQDVTLRKQAEEHIAYQARLLASVNDAIVGSDADFRLTVWNAIAESMYGWKAEEVLGRHGLEVLQTQWPQESADEMRRRIAETGRWRGEATQLRRDGTRIPVEVSSMVLRNEHDQVTGYVSVNRDITHRKQAERALQESEQRLKHAQEIAHLGSWELDLLNNRLTWSDEVYRIFGLQPQEFDATYEAFLEAVHPDDRAAVDNAYSGSIREGRDSYEIEHRVVKKPGGEVRIVHEKCEHFRDQGGQIVKSVGMVHDITERKKAEQALRESEERYRGLMESQLDLIVRVDPEGRFTFVNDAYCQKFGLKREEILGRESYKTFVHPEDLPHTLEAMKALYQPPYRAIMEQRAFSVEGLRWIEWQDSAIRDETGKIVEIQAIGRDITARKQAEEALQESEERFRSLADSMPQLVWTALPDGTVDYYNQRYQEYQELKQVQGSTWEWSPVLHPDDLQSTANAWQRSVETGEIYQIEHRVRMATGSYRWHLSRGVPMRDEMGRIIRWFGTATDIHDLKLAEEQLKVYAERLERSNRALEQFAFMASHDLQEPLRKIETFGDLLLERATQLDERGHNYIERMRGAASRMRDMVEGLLHLSRVTTQGKPFIRVDLSQVTAEVVSDLEDQIRRTGGKVDLGMLPTIEGDPLQLRQLMQNLIGNALKYHQPGKPPEVNVYAKQLSGKVQIHVEDQGIGFEQEDAERIFEPFLRLVGRSQYEGSGMGLAICHRIVERHGGNIAAFSKPGHGTTFIVTLPTHHSESVGNELRKDASDEEPGTPPGR